MTNDPRLGRRTNYLRAWREYRGLTQAQLAAIIGTEGSVISLLESGDRGLSDRWLRRLAPALETTPSLLLDFEPAQVDATMLELWPPIRSPEGLRRGSSSDPVPDKGRAAKWPRVRTRTEIPENFDARIDPGFDIPELWSRIADEDKPAALAALRALIPRH
jgi:transcriptional regulator with XRE-family HTH domain